VRTRIVLTSLTAALMVATVATPAAAQTPPPPHPFVIHAEAGLTFGGPTGALFGAGAGVDIAAVPGLTVFGEVGRLTNIMNSDLQDLVDELAGVDESDEFDISLPTVYGLGGARFTVPTNGPLGVFVEGGIGVGRVGIDVTLVIDGVDVSDDLEDELDEQDITEPSTEPLFFVGGGLSYPVTPRADITGGLRLTRIAAGDGITKPAIYVGVLWRP
jgi:hypothetical protein